MCLCKLIDNGQGDTETQLSEVMRSFVSEYDGPSNETLLVVYYNGNAAEDFSPEPGLVLTRLVGLMRRPNSQTLTY